MSLSDLDTMMLLVDVTSNSCNSINKIMSESIWVCLFVGVVGGISVMLL